MALPVTSPFKTRNASDGRPMPYAVPRGVRRGMPAAVRAIPTSRGIRVQRFWFLLLALMGFALGLLLPRHLKAQEVRIRDLTIGLGTAPVRLVGYGIVVGLDGTGDRSLTGRAPGQTVLSVANLLRRFQIEVPAEVLQPRNVAAVLVTAEVSPFLRTGGRFDVHVASMSDARSLKGGVLYMTPLVSEVGAAPVATAQGGVVLSDGSSPRDIGGPVETSVRIPSGGMLESDLPRPALGDDNMLLLKEPDLGTASRMAAAIDSVVAKGTASVDDAGAVSLALKETGTERAAILTKIRNIKVRPERAARVVIDSRDGTIVAGGDLTLGEATVAHGPVTLTIGQPSDSTAPRGDVRFPSGVSVQKVASALHAVQVTAGEMAAIFTSLRDVGALSAEVVVR
jgi:flagellar P-ring protein precursor FlgI